MKVIVIKIMMMISDVSVDGAKLTHSKLSPPLHHVQKQGRNLSLVNDQISKETPVLLVTPVQKNTTLLMNGRECAVAQWVSNR
jgi:hypothetical protein